MDHINQNPLNISPQSESLHSEENIISSEEIDLADIFNLACTDLQESIEKNKNILCEKHDIVILQEQEELDEELYSTSQKECLSIQKDLEANKTEKESKLEGILSSIDNLILEEQRVQKNLTKEIDNEKILYKQINEIHKILIPLSDGNFTYRDLTHDEIINGVFQEKLQTGEAFILSKNSDNSYNISFIDKNICPKNIKLVDPITGKELIIHIKQLSLEEIAKVNLLFQQYTQLARSQNKEEHKEEHKPEEHKHTETLQQFRPLENRISIDHKAKVSSKAKEINKTVGSIIRRMIERHKELAAIRKRNEKIKDEYLLEKRDRIRRVEIEKEILKAETLNGSRKNQEINNESIRKKQRSGS